MADVIFRGFACGPGQKKTVRDTCMEPIENRSDNDFGDIDEPLNINQLTGDDS